MTNAHDNLTTDIGQLLVVGFDGATSTAPDSIAESLAEERIGGVILFGRNIGDVDQIVELTAHIHDAAAEADAPPFVAVDQEGGRVMRIRDPLTPLPTARALGAAADMRDVVRVAEVQAKELCALGFNLNFAPVLDVDTNPDNPVIGDRAFCDDPKKVARCGAGVLLGHHRAGVIPCGKHFPGHGDTDRDSHKELPRIDHDRERLEQIELYPFQRAVAADIPMLMTAHIEVPALDDEHPATLSRPIITDLLRRDFGYDGVVITDCLEMSAVADRYDITEMVELGIRAGVDIFLICHTEEKWQAAFDHLNELARRDDDFRTRIEAAAARVRRLKQDLLGHWPRPWSPRDGFRELLGSPDHRQLVEPYLDGNTAHNDDDPTAPGG